LSVMLIANGHGFTSEVEATLTWGRAIGRVPRSQAGRERIHAAGGNPLVYPECLKRLLGLSEGMTSRVCRVLEAAAIHAIETGRERIDVDVLTDDLATATLVSITDRQSRRPHV
jgi:hypothetical protein